ncbi:MAG: hypothetical protein OXC38_06350 [Gammaproteobacteria bacterium]|nr:hypothetical protein [Gammaproteobacteria bacterium]
MHPDTRAALQEFRADMRASFRELRWYIAYVGAMTIIIVKSLSLV